MKPETRDAKDAKEDKPPSPPWIRHARKRVELDFNGEKYTRVAGVACLHVGNPSCRESSIRRMIRHFVDDSIPFILMGDLIEAITPVDKRFHCETHQATVQSQKEWAADLVRPGRELLIGVIRGNHEDKIAALYGNPIRDILTRMFADDRNWKAEAMTRWMGGLAVTDLVCPDGVCKWMVHHPRITITRGIGDPDHDEAVRRRALRRFARFWLADVKMLAHAHRFVIAPPTFEDRLDYSGTKVREVQDPISRGWVASCASMFAGYDTDTEYPSYAENVGYAPTQIGWLEAVIDRSGKVVTVEAIKG